LEQISTTSAAPPSGSDSSAELPGGNRRSPRGRAVASWLGRGALLFLLTCATLEIATRAYFSLSVGPRIFFYGTPWHRNVQTPAAPPSDPWADSVQHHGNNVGDYHSYDPSTSSYSKYFPGETKWTESPDRSERYPVRINNHGFRGADFTDQKAPGTIRILTLGASSTFGYHDRDDETYPFLLERDLQRTAPPGVHFEVINFAIPHATTDNILAMFLAEGVALQPDVVTFYEGINDSVGFEPKEGSGEGLYDELVHRSVLLAFVDSVWPRSAAVDTSYWRSDELASRRSKKFLGNLTRLAAECQRRNIRLIVATQQAQSLLVPPEKMRGLTYDQEVALVRQRFDQSPTQLGSKDVPQLVFQLRTTASDEFGARAFAMFDPPRDLLIHARLMADLRVWASQSNVGFVDMIHELDARRDLMVNWVHLTAEANAIVAGAFAREIRRELDPPAAGAGQS
jgi:lysophospholipase L1-like esterase